MIPPPHVRTGCHLIIEFPTDLGGGFMVRAAPMKITADKNSLG